MNMNEIVSELDWMLESARKNPMKIHHDVETRMRIWATQILPGRLQEIISTGGDPDYIGRMVNLVIDDYDRLVRRVQKEYIDNQDIELYHILNNQLFNITLGIIKIYEDEIRKV